jgi:hypothetical protein
MADLGFEREAYDRMHMHVRLLDGIRSHPFLGSRLVLKGGAAINLFGRELLRAPLDVDLNYVAARSRAAMLAERPLFFEAIQEVVADLSLQQTTVVEGHINFLLRTPLWPTVRKDSLAIGGEAARHVVLENEHELAAAKLAAVVARSASRDLFDGRELLRRGNLDRAKLRLGFMMYGALASVDWREISGADIDTSAGDVAQLLPLLRRDIRPEPGRVEAWTKRLVDETRALMTELLAFDADEREFLDRLYTAGEIAPELLTSDAYQQTAIRDHPAVMSKVRRVRKRLGLAIDGIVEDDAVMRFRMVARWQADDSPTAASQGH